jgi:hypothetical protein
MPPKIIFRTCCACGNTPDSVYGCYRGENRFTCVDDCDVACIEKQCYDEKKDKSSYGFCLPCQIEQTNKMFPGENQIG